MTFKEELLKLKADLQQKKNYRTKYISDQIRDDYDLHRELNKRGYYDLLEWPLYNSREAIDNQKPASLMKTIEAVKAGIKSYIASLLDDGVDFDSIDMILELDLFLEESKFKDKTPADQLTVDDFLADTVNISSINFITDGSRQLCTQGKRDTTVSYSELHEVLTELGFRVPEKSFEELVEDRKQSKHPTIRYSIPLTNEKDIEDSKGEEPKGPSLK